MEELLANPNYEFFRPLTSSWVEKLEGARQSRQKWKEVADECMMFYSKSAAAMWDPTYTRRFWRGVKAPRFRFSMNKAFELVAVFAPNLLWEVPHRTVEPKRKLEIPEDFLQLLGSEPMGQQLLQTMLPAQQMSEARDRVVAYLMQNWLNYTPQEQSGGGLVGHSEMAVIDSLIKGRGVLVSRPYLMPSSGRTLTGSFRIPPEDLLIDPDFKSPNEAKWIAIKHVEPHWEVERRFELPAGSLKGRSSLESSWNYAELKTSEDASMHRAAGMTNDLVVWYEIFSKTGPGARMTSMQSPVKEHLERVVGDYAYICVSANVPYPLNCSSDALRSGMTDDAVREKFSWPVPFWADDRWPVRLLDYYPDPEGAWPIPPLAPALGELKFLNFLIPWLANRIYSSSRDFWAVAGPQVEHYTKYLQEGLDQTIIPTPVNVEDVKKAITVLQQPETRLDAWKIVELVSELFDKRTGLTEFVYGRNEGGTQNRTAEETLAKKQAVGVRPGHMRQKVVAWQSEIATTEAFITRWFVTGEDVEPLLGPLGRVLWDQFISSSDVELVVRQMTYTVSAASIRPPNRERDIANFQQIMGLFAPAAMEFGMQHGNFEPYNYLVKKWAEFHDADLDGALFPPPEPDDQQQQLEQMQMQLEMAKIQAELEGKEIDVQAKALDGQIKQRLAQMKLLSDEQSMEMDAEKHAQQLRQDRQQHLLDIFQDRQKFNQDLEQARRMGELKLRLARTQKNQTNGASK